MDTQSQSNDINLRALANAIKLRALAQTVRENPLHREAIADGFDLIADAMEPCEDCGRTSLGEEGQAA